MASTLQRLDAYLATLLSDWGLATTFIAVALVALVAYPIIYPDEPDTHPLLLARQSSAAPIRNKNESAAYRSPETPYGTNLRSGLNVKDVGAPRWAGGKDGDLRDVWREVQRGGQQGEDGKEVPRGLIMTVLGRDEVVEHDVSDISKEIGILGRHWKAAGVTKVAIYLPNSVEYLSAIFGELLVIRFVISYADRILSMCVPRPHTNIVPIQAATRESLRPRQQHRGRWSCMCSWQSSTGRCCQVMREHQTADVGRGEDQ